MSRSFAALLLVLLCSGIALAAQESPSYEDLPTSAGVGKWRPQEKAQAHKITVDGDAIYLDGVLQKAKYTPDMDVMVKNGEVLLVPKGQGLTLRPKAAQQP